MDIIKCIFVAIVILLICYGAGWSMNRIMKNTDISNVSVGFISVLAIFQIFALPFMWFETKFTILYIISLLLVGICGIYVLSNIKELKIDIKGYISKEKMLWLFAIGIIMLQIIGYVVLQHSDADDAFFVSEISTILDTNYINKFECTTGIQEYMFSPQYKLVGWEVLLSIFCKFFRMNPAMFCHTCLPLVLVAVHYYVVWDISKEIHKDRPIIPFLSMCILNVFGNYAAYTRESFLLFRIWQGKSVYVNIVLPLMLLLMFKVFKKVKEMENKYIILLTFVLYASLNTTAVGIFLGPLAYGIYVLTYIFFSKSIRDFIKLCIPVLCVLPNVIMKFLYLIRFSTIEDVGVGYESLDWMSQLQLVTGNRLYLIVIFIGLICIIIFKGDNAEKYLFGVYPLLCLSTFLNPLISKFVAGHITGVPVYWRLFWNLQLTFIVVAAISIVSRIIKYRAIFLVMLAGIIVCQNGYIYTKENFTWIKNLENVDDTSYGIVRCLENESTNEDIILFAPEEYTYDIRQMSGKIKLAWSRNIHPDYLLEMYERLYSNKNILEEDLDKLKEMHINYLALYKGTVLSHVVDKCELIFEDQNVVIVKVK